MSSSTPVLGCGATFRPFAEVDGNTLARIELAAPAPLTVLSGLLACGECIPLWSFCASFRAVLAFSSSSLIAADSL